MDIGLKMLSTQLLEASLSTAHQLTKVTSTEPLHWIIMYYKSSQVKGLVESYCRKIIRSHKLKEEFLQFCCLFFSL